MKLYVSNGIFEGVLYGYGFVGGSWDFVNLWYVIFKLFDNLFCVFVGWCIEGLNKLKVWKFCYENECNLVVVWLIDDIEWMWDWYISVLLN